MTGNNNLFYGITVEMLKKWSISIHRQGRAVSLVHVICTLFLRPLLLYRVLCLVHPVKKLNLKNECLRH